MFGVQILQSLSGDMGINLRCGQIAMPKQKLYTAKICAVIDQMRGKGMAQSVRRNIAFNP